MLMTVRRLLYLQLDIYIQPSHPFPRVITSKRLDRTDRPAWQVDKRRREGMCENRCEVQTGTCPSPLPLRSSPALARAATGQAAKPRGKVGGGAEWEAGAGAAWWPADATRTAALRSGTPRS